MSLINKVLRDLDARSTTRGSATPKAVHRGLRPAASVFSRKRPVWLVPVLTVVVAVIAYVGVSATLAPLPYSGFVLAAIGLEKKPEAVRVATVPLANAESPSVVPTIAKPTAIAAKSANKPATKPKKTIAAKKPVARKAPIKNASKRTPVKKRARTKRRSVAKRKKKVIVAAKHRGELKKNIQPISVAEKAENAFREGAIAMEQGNQALAERKLRLALKQNPKYAQAYELLAGVLISSGRSADGRRVLTESLTQLPGHAQLSNLLARLYVDQGRDADAIRLLEQAQKKNTLNPQLMSFRAALYQRGGRHAEAARTYRNALTVAPNEGKWWIGLAISLEAQRDWIGARSAYEKALTVGLSPQLAQYARQRISVVKVSK